MAKNIFLIFFLSLLVSPLASANTLDELLEKIMNERAYETEEFRKREKEFKDKRDQRKKFLAKAVKEFKKKEAIGVRLTKEFEENEKDLSILETELNLATGVLGELFGIVKQVAGDLRGQILNSLVSAEIPNRQKFIESIVSRRKLPNTEDLRKLWFEIQREMTEIGKVTQFESNVVSLDGKKSKNLITRVGGFNLVSDGKYLHYSGDVGQILELFKQPSSRFTRYIDDIETAKPNSYTPFAVDPSRGALVSILIRVPSLWERIKQGGLIGAVIILVLIFGLSLVVQRWIILRREKNKIMAQLKSQVPNEDNPIGQILLIYEKNKNLSLESLDLRFNEIIIGYLPCLEKGLSTIKILAVLSPLLGLLGTVTGMILTFQSITLFGTGDPKLMAGGISQALVTTVQGLCSAVPLLLCHNFLSTRSQNLIQILEEQVAGLLAEKMQKSEAKH